MKYDDLEKTKDLFDIEDDVPQPIRNIEMEGVSKDNLEEDFTLGLKKDSEEMKKSPKKIRKNKKKFRDKWKNLSKKNKLLIIVGLILLIAIVVVLILILIFKDEDNIDKPKIPEVPQVIVEKENYVYKSGLLSFLNSEETEIGTYKCKNEDENLCYVVNYTDEDNFDVSKNVYENGELISRRSSIYLDNYVFIYDNSTELDGIIVLYNISEQKEEGAYTLVKGFNDSNYVILKDDNNKYGVLEFTSEGIVEKLEFSFDYLGMMDKNSNIVAKSNNKYYIYNLDGGLESKGLAYEIKSYNNKYIVVDNGGYYVYDYKSNLIFDESYDYVELLNNYVVLISNNKLFIKDYKNNKYNEEGISLEGKNYSQINKYSDKLVLVESLKSYYISESNNSLEVIYYKNNKEKNETINTLDGKLSSNYEYLNYFNGKLYFYNDEEENNLIGKYECSNKNNTDKSTTELTSCLPASDAFYSKNEVEEDNSDNIGWIPIFNEKYIFIADSIDVDNKTIVLYNLETGKTLSKYASVDTGSYTGEDKITFIETDGVYVMAQNKNNKYGIIKVGEEASSAVGFDYASIEKLREYYLAKEEAGTYLLLNEAGQEITNKYGYKIVDYKGNYLKVVDDDNKYYVYDFNGEKIEETGYLYITLNDDYYVVINTDKKLDIHKYDDASFKLSSTIDVSTDKFDGAYEVSKSSSGFIIKIKSSGEVINADSNGVVAGDEVDNELSLDVLNEE